MKQERLLRFAIDAGEITMTSGAEAYRAEETIIKILETKYENFSASFVIGTGLFASIHTEDGKDYTAVRRIKKRSIDLEKLSSVNSVARGFVSGESTLLEAENELEKLKTRSENKAFRTIIGIGLSSAFFAPLLGGTLLDALAAGIVGLILGVSKRKPLKSTEGVFIENLKGGILIAIFASILKMLGLLNGIDAVIISALMPLLPGAAFTSAIRDIIEEDYLSGTARLMEAIIVTISLVAGVTIGLSFFHLKGIDPIINITFISNPIAQIFFAGAATYFFCILFKVPKEELILCSAVGAIGWTSYIITSYFSSSPSFCAFIGTLVVGFLSRLFAYMRKKPQTVFFLPGIIPYVPGAGIYYTMEAIKNRNISLALSKGLETITIAGAIAVAVGLIAVLSPKIFIMIKSWFKPKKLV